MNEYPKWQQGIRKTQHLYNQMKEVEDAAAKEKKETFERERRAKLGDELVTVLGWLGVDIENPGTNRVILEGGYHILMSFPIKLETRLNKPSIVRFSLEIGKLACPAKDGYPEQFIWETFDYSEVGETVPDSEIVRFAGAIDRVDKKCESALQIRNEHIESERLSREELDYPPPQEKSTSEKLTELIRELIREETGRYEW